MKLGVYFTKREFEHSATAIRNHIQNEMNEEQTANARNLVQQVLDPLRSWLGSPVIISSGYRCKRLNKLLGGANNSQHTKGEAADLKVGAKAFNYIRENLPFDQLIWEFGNDSEPDWVHVSLKRSGHNRKEVLRARMVNGKTVYERM